jgi:RNA polymerase sigma-70 factor (ECF subfamily)
VPVNIVALDERRLLPRHCQGEPQAFAELVKSFRGPVFSYLVRCGLNRAACDDVFQDIFIKVHNAAKSYEPEKPLKPWLFTIVVNTVRSHYRKERVRQLVVAVETPEAASREPRPDERVEASQTAAVLEREIAKLSFAEREVVLLCATEQLEQKDVAEMLGLPLGTVKTHLHRARATLARALSRREGVR